MSTALQHHNTLAQETTFDKIQSWYIDDTDKIKLSQKHEDIRVRWESAYGLLCNYHSPQDAIPGLDKLDKRSKAQAYRDIKNAHNLFGDIQATSKDGVRSILYEYAMKIFQLATNDKNITEMNRAMSNLIKLKGLDRDDPEIPDFSRLKPTTQVIKLESDFLDKFGHLLDKKVLDSMKKSVDGKIFFEYKDVIDIPFIEVPNE